MSRVLAVRLTDNEFERFQHVCKQLEIGTSTGLHLAVKAFLADPLPEWAEQAMRELYDLQSR